MCHLRRRLRMFLFHVEIIYCSRYSSFSIFNYPMIYHICDVHETGCIFQSLIQKKIGSINFSGMSWVVLLIWHYNNIYYGLRSLRSLMSYLYVSLEIIKKILSWSFLGDIFWAPIVLDCYHFGSGCGTVFECLLKHCH